MSFLLPLPSWTLVTTVTRLPEVLAEASALLPAVWVLALPAHEAKTEAMLWSWLVERLLEVVPVSLKLAEASARAVKPATKVRRAILVLLPWYGNLLMYTSVLTARGVTIFPDETRTLSFREM
jgi:hypothetical protein